MKRIRDIFIGNIQKLKGILIFLSLSTIIIGGWKFAHLDDILFMRLAGFLTRLISLEINLSQFIIKDILGIPSSLTGDVITMPNRSALLMNPGCTGLKQVIQLFLIMLFYPGPILRKAWYLPVASLVLLISSVLHFVLLAFLLETYALHIAFFHDHLSRWLYFTIFFLVWIIWEDYIRKPKMKVNSHFINY
jgi:exosortase/archaeosortase family protein